jgi:hypothetical protein
MLRVKTKHTPSSQEELGIWLALDLLALAPQTDQVLRQRCRLMTDLAMLGRKEVQQ